MVAPNTPTDIAIENTLLADIKDHQNWFAGLGIVFIVLGVLAIAFPWVATLSLNLTIGILVLLSGFALGAQSFYLPKWRGQGMNLGLAAMAILAGVLMLVFPVAGIITLTTLVMLFFLFTGAAKTWFALQMRPAIGWGWILTSGLLSLSLGLLILFQITEVFPWVLGVLLAIDFIFGGVWMLILASRAKQIP